MTNKQPEALRLAQHLEQFRSFPDDLAAAKELRRQYARIAELESQLSVAQQASEPYAVLVFERGEEGPFDRKPVKPGSVQHLHAKRDPHYDCIELYTHPTKQGMDAQIIQALAAGISIQQWQSSVEILIGSSDLLVRAIASGKETRIELIRRAVSEAIATKAEKKGDQS